MSRDCCSAGSLAKPNQKVRTARMTEECQVEDCVLDLRRHVFLLCFLEVKLGEDVEPVGYLNDEEKLEEESHVVVRITFPYGGYIEEILSEDEVSSPEQ